MNGERDPAIAVLFHRAWEWSMRRSRHAERDRSGAAGGVLPRDLERLRQGERRPAGRARVHQPDRRGIRSAHDSLRACAGCRDMDADRALRAATYFLQAVAGEGLPPWRSDASLSRGARRGAAGGLDDRAAGIERTALAGRTGRHGFHLYRHCDNGAERTHVPRLALRSWRSRF